MIADNIKFFEEKSGNRDKRIVADIKSKIEKEISKNSKRNSPKMSKKSKKKNSNSSLKSPRKLTNDRLNFLEKPQSRVDQRVEPW